MSESPAKIPDSEPPAVSPEQVGTEEIHLEVVLAELVLDAGALSRLRTGSRITLDAKEVRCGVLLLDREPLARCRAEISPSGIDMRVEELYRPPPKIRRAPVMTTPSFGEYGIR